MSSERRRFKLHSIIEKLSEQGGRGSPSHDEENEDLSSHFLSGPTVATASKRKSQRKGAAKRVEEEVCYEEEEFNGDHSNLYTVEVPTYNSACACTADNSDDDCEWISRKRRRLSKQKKNKSLAKRISKQTRNYSIEKKKKKRLPKKIKRKPLHKRVLNQRRRAKLAEWRKKNAQERQARLALETALREKAAARGLHTTDRRTAAHKPGSNWPGAHLKDSDLWLDRFIEMASFVKLGAQMEDIDYSSPLERCWFCEQGPFEGQESLSTHIEETHPDICLFRRNYIRDHCSDSDEDEELVERVKAKEDENLLKGSILTEGRRSSLRVQHLGMKALHQDEENEDSSSHSQRKGAAERVEEEVCSEEEEFDVDCSNLDTVEVPTSNSIDTSTSDSSDDDCERILGNDSTEKKRQRLPKKIKRKPLHKRVLNQRRRATLADWRKKNAQERQARLALETALREKAAARGLHTTDRRTAAHKPGPNWPGARLKDSDLWLDRFIEMASFVKLGAQVEDIDYSSPLEQCWFCEQGPFEGQESLSTHIEETHPDICLFRRNYFRDHCSDSDEDEELVEKVKAKEDENLPKGSVLTEGRRSSLRVQSLKKKPLYEVGRHSVGSFGIDLELYMELGNCIDM